MLGQVCYKLGRNEDAMRNFNTAIDLDPKQALVLKVGMLRCLLENVPEELTSRLS